MGTRRLIGESRLGQRNCGHTGLEQEKTLCMLPLIYTARAYTITFVSVIVISRVPEVIFAYRFRSQRDSTARQVDRGSFVVMSIVVGGGVIVACVLAAVWTGAAIPWLRPQVTLAGIVVILLGAAVRWWAIFTLGRYFTFDVAVRPTQLVVQAGPYRFVRHPSYTAILIMLLGAGNGAGELGQPHRDARRWADRAALSRRGGRARTG